MLGKLLSSAVKVVTLPIDVVEAGLDIAAGGDGSKESRQIISQVRDELCEELKELDG